MSTDAAPPVPPTRTTRTLSVTDAERAVLTTALASLYDGSPGWRPQIGPLLRRVEDLGRASDAPPDVYTRAYRDVIAGRPMTPDLAYRAACVALAAAHHALTTLNGLRASERVGPGIENDWTIDESATIALIDAVLRVDVPPMAEPSSLATRSVSDDALRAALRRYQETGIGVTTTLGRGTTADERVRLESMIAEQMVSPGGRGR